MEVEAICFNLARLTGVVYCGSVLPLMASNSSNGSHLLSFHRPSLRRRALAEGEREKNNKNAHNLFV